MKEKSEHSEKRNLQVIENTVNGHHQTSRDEKNLKRVSQENEKTTRNQTIEKKVHQRDKHQPCPPRKILGIIFNAEKGRTSTNGSENKKTHDNAQGLTSQRWHEQTVSRKE